MNTNRTRWERLAARLTVAGIDAKLSQRSGPGAYFISIPAGDVNVEVHDKWWSKNPDVWIGWQVHTDNVRTMLSSRGSALTKKQSEVVAAVREELAKAAA
jgi:hypothetical protein